MIRYTRAEYHSGTDTLCYVAEAPATSVICECLLPDRTMLNLPLERLSEKVYLLEFTFSQVGNYIMSLYADGQLMSVLNAKVNT